MSAFTLNIISRNGLSRLVPIFSENTINRSYRGDTPLNLAVLNNHFKTAERLIDCGANADSFDSYKNSPLAIAVCLDRPKMLELLLENGADPLKKHPEAFNLDSPIEHAFGKDEKNLIQVFISSSKVTEAALGIGLFALLAGKGKLQEEELHELVGLEPEKLKKVKKLASQYALRKIAFNVLGEKGTFYFHGNEMQKIGLPGASGAMVMHKQQAQIYTIYLKQIKGKQHTEYTQEEMELIAFFEKQENSNQVIDNIKHGRLQGIDAYYLGHFFQVVFFKGYVAFCNIKFGRNKDFIIDVFKINPLLVKNEDLASILQLRTAKADIAKKQIRHILSNWDPDKDQLCKAYQNSFLQNKEQDGGNCTAKSGNAAKRFIQTMQLFFQFPGQDPEQVLKTDQMQEVVADTKRQSAFRKMDILCQVMEQGSLSEEDEEWFTENALKRIEKWTSSSSLHDAEAHMIIKLIDGLRKFGRTVDTSQFPSAHKNILKHLQEEKKEWFRAVFG